MSLFKAIVMAVVLLALGAYVYFVELPHEKEEAAKKKLFTFDKAAVTEVQLTYPERSLHLKKDETGKWRILQPIDTEADETTVTNLVNAIADAEISRILDDPVQDPALYGLNAPVVKLQVILKNGETLPQVSIGKDTPVGYSVYMQKEGETKLLLTPQAFRLGMTKEVKDVRDKTVLALKPDEVKKVEIQRQGSEIVLTKVDSGWSLEKPVSGKADDSQVQTFLSSVQNMKAQDFVEAPILESKEYGLDPPQLAVSLMLGDNGARKTLLVGGEKTQEKGVKQRYIKRGEKDTLFLVGDWIFRDLNKSVDDFRDKTIAKFSQDKAVKIEVKRQDGQGFILTKSVDKKWGIDKSEEGVFKEATATQLVSALADLRGFEIAAENPTDLRAYGLSTPALSIVAYDEKEQKLAAVLTTQQAEGETKKTFAMAEGGKTVFALRDYMFDRLNKAPTDFWEKPTEKEAPATSDHEDHVHEEDLPEEEEDD
jgi:hypothetical protein